MFPQQDDRSVRQKSCIILCLCSSKREVKEKRQVRWYLLIANLWWNFLSALYSPFHQLILCVSCLLTTWCLRDNIHILGHLLSMRVGNNHSVSQFLCLWNGAVPSPIHIMGLWGLKCAKHWEQDLVSVAVCWTLNSLFLRSSLDLVLRNQQ